MELAVSVKRIPDLDDYHPGGQAYLVSVPFVPRLLSQALGIGLVVDGSPGEASEDNPIRLWLLLDSDTVMPKNALDKALRELPDPDQVVTLPSYRDQLLRKLSAETVDTDVMLEALRFLLGGS
jgi:hypothetical protein